MLTHFRVSNYKCLVDVELPLTPIHVLIGQNDSGKTSLLEAMLAFSRTAEMPLAEAFIGEWEGRELVNDQVKIPIVDFAAQFGVSDANDSPGIRYHLKVDFSSSKKGPICKEEAIFNPKRQNLAPHSVDEEGRAYTKVSTWFENNKLKHNDKSVSSWIYQMGSSVLYRFEPRVMATPSGIDSKRKFRMDPDGFGLPGLLDDISGFDPHTFLKIREEFCQYFPQFHSVRLETEPALMRIYNKRGRLSRVVAGEGKGIHFETQHGQSIRAQQVSDGAILFLGFLALTHSPNPPKLLLLEEPEKGVYPKRLEEIIRIIKGLHATRPAGTVPQVIMTTHSPYLLSFFEPEEVTLLSRRGKTGPVRARPLRDAPHIHERLGSEFYLGELWYNLTQEELFGDA